MDLLNILEYSLYLSPILCALGCAVGFQSFSRLSSICKLFTSYLFLAMITDIASRVAAVVFDSNLVFIPFFGLVELIFFSLLFRYFLLPQTSIYLLGLSIVGVIWIVIDIMFTIDQEPYYFQSYGKVLSNGIILCYVLHYFKNFIIGALKREQHYYMSLIIVLFIYLGITFLLVLPVNLLVNSNSSIVFIFWSIQFVSTILLYSYIIYFQWKNGRTKTYFSFG